VARCGDEIVGFAGCGCSSTRPTSRPSRRGGPWRRQGIGERLLLALLDLAAARGAHEATLEVRPSNLPARRLYEKYGFKVVGVRPRYYSDNNEDALIMTTDALEGRSMRERIAELRAAVAARPDIELGRRRAAVRSDRGRPRREPGPAARDDAAGRLGGRRRPAARRRPGAARRDHRPSSATRRKL
jgi:hypothetical protein